MAPRTLLAGFGDVHDIGLWSGTPFHLLQAGSSAGLFDAGLALQPAQGARWRRYAWNLAAVLRGRGRGGYQFSAPALERLWQPLRGRLAGTRVLNTFQLYAPSVTADHRVEKWFYIDQTLAELFEGYGLGSTIGAGTRAELLAREQQGYRQAAGIITHSQWAAERVLARGGIASERVHVVVPGANLDPAAQARWSGQRPALSGPGAPLRLVFVGKDPLRKGLDRLLRALGLARAQGLAYRLTVIGCRPEALPAELRATADVDWRGFIDKRRDPDAYLQAVSDHDLGCLLSRAEAGGVCLREFHALGLAAMAPEVGGSPDHVLPEASCLVRPDAGDDRIAALLLRLWQSPDEIRRMREASWRRRAEVGWAHSVQRMAAILGAHPGRTRAELQG